MKREPLLRRRYAFGITCSETDRGQHMDGPDRLPHQFIAKT
ncbi:hypothetical protein [Pseudovibrio sp. SPO723]|nr:hypothetical protein [Pseudovibrio sp. SPO723]MDX5595620.1 hypothetical protein [Pseudovibrio sp. SPO723]